MTRRDVARLSATLLVTVLAFAALALLVTGGTGPWASFDQRVLDVVRVRVFPHPEVVVALEVLAFVTHPNAWRAVAAVIAVVLWQRGRHGIATWLVVTMALGGVLSPLLKAIVGRERPVFADPVSSADGYAFPSGHALASMLFAACLIVLARSVARDGRRSPARRAVAVGVVIVAITGIDRIALGVHYASDVLAGWLVALATVTVTTIAFGIRPGDAARPPTASPGPTSARRR
ncbi:MAG: hypothetical protein QG622_1962 [Actinomycetota bacterium]|nr:hypothetical protein [Actinomycetota bacterium]